MEDDQGGAVRQVPAIVVVALAAATVTGLVPGGLGYAGQAQAVDEDPGQAPARVVPVPEEWRIDDRVVVGFEDGQGPGSVGLEALAAAHEAHGVRVDERLDLAVVSVPAVQQDALVDTLASQDGIAYVMPDVRIEGTGFTPDDPLLPDQWAVDAIGLETAWGRTLGDGTVEVAVIDSGTRYTHEDLQANVCKLGPDFVNLDDDPDDTHGHGTHVAGTVAAEIDNGVGVAGMANACVVPVKVLDEENSGSSVDIASAIAWAGAQDVDVASASLGGCPGCPKLPPMEDAVEFAWDQGTLLVAAAHNQDCSPVTYPAAYPEVVSVASLRTATERSGFSNCGPENELSAPGSAIVSTLPTDDATWTDPSGYGPGWGTSMATPHVSGVAAQLMALDPSLTNVEVRCILQETADDLGPAGPDEKFGIGRLDATEATALPSPSQDCDGLWPPAPANDEPEGATPIAYGETITQHTAGATEHTHERAVCGTLQGATVWFAYEPDNATPAEVTVDTFGSSFDTVLSVYLDTPGGPVLLACNDDAGGERRSQVSFQAAPGVDYLVQVGGWSADQGLVEVTVS